MSYQIRLELKDYLTYQLYAVSQSKRIKQKKNRSWFIFPIVFVAIGIIMNQQGLKSASGYFILALIWAVAYPFYFKWLYQRHFKRYVNDVYAKKADNLIEIEIGNDYIFSKDDETEAKFKLNQFYAFIDLPDHILLQLDKGDTLIIPKSTNSYANIESELRSKAEKFSIEWKNQLGWKW